MALLASIVFLAQGIVGGMAAYSRWVRGYSDFAILKPVGASIYVCVLLATGPVFVHYIKSAESNTQLFMFAVLFFAILGNVMWSFALVLQTGAGWLGASDMRVDKLFDKADAMIARKNYAEAEALLREEIRKDPQCPEAPLRLAHMLRRIERSAEAARVLAMAREAAAAPVPAREMPTAREIEERRESLMRLTYALGDVLVEDLDDPAAARALYARTIDALSSSADADPLRDRIRQLDSPDRIGFQQAAEQAQPDRITF